MAKKAGDVDLYNRLFGAAPEPIEEGEVMDAEPGMAMLHAVMRDGGAALEEIPVVAIRNEPGGCMIPLTAEKGATYNLMRMDWAIQYQNGVVANRWGQWSDKEAYLRAWERSV
jgi:hypothetical protein